LLGDQSRIAREARAKREAKLRAKILRQCEVIEKLQAMLPAKQAREPVNRLLREVLRTIRASLNGPCRGEQS
jgi:hypothetical protein